VVQQVHLPMEKDKAFVGTYRHTSLQKQKPLHSKSMQPINLHYRKTIRLKEYDYSSPGEYFVTLCTHQRDDIFGTIVNESVCLSPAGNIIKQYWEEIPKHFENVELDEFIIMPNHIHGIIVLTEPIGVIHESPLPMTQRQRRTMTLSKIIGRFKMLTAKEINLMHNAPGHPVWQRNYYEHIIRNDKDLNNIREYIVNNPMQWHVDEENPKKDEQIAMNSDGIYY
jgi:REP element-mobilizing transposase RayT